MKICIYAHSLPPIIGGAQTYQYNLAISLGKMGHDVLVLTGSLPDNLMKDADKYKSKYYKTIRVAGFRESIKLNNELQNVLFQTYKEIKKFNPDIVYSNGYIPCLNICIIKKALRNFKHVFSYHSTPEIDVNKLVGVWPGHFDLEKSLANFIFDQSNIDYYLACSFNYLNTVKKYINSNIKKYKVIYYGVDLDKFSFKKKVEKQTLNLKEEDRVVLCPVRMIERKGILDMLDAIKILKDNPKIGNNIKLVIPTSKLSSKNTFYQKVKGKIKKLKLNNNVVIISDKFLINDMPTLYALSDIMILPSYAEGLGIVLLEAMAMKKPVVATDIPGINEVVKHGETGLLVPIKSPKLIASSIEKIIFDEKLKNHLVESGYRFINKNFNLETQVKKIEKLFKSII